MLKFNKISTRIFAILETTTIQIAMFSNDGLQITFILLNRILLLALSYTAIIGIASFTAVAENIQCNNNGI